MAKYVTEVIRCRINYFWRIQRIGARDHVSEMVACNCIAEECCCGLEVYLASQGSSAFVEEISTCDVLFLLSTVTEYSNWRTRIELLEV